MAEIMEEEASVRNLGRLKSLIRPAGGPAGAELPRALEVFNRRVRNLFRRGSSASGVNGEKPLRQVVASVSRPVSARLWPR